MAVVDSRFIFSKPLWTATQSGRIYSDTVTDTPGGHPWWDCEKRPTVRNQSI